MENQSDTTSSPTILLSQRPLGSVHNQESKMMGKIKISLSWSLIHNADI
jgi:hypothetical protein